MKNDLSGFLQLLESSRRLAGDELFRASETPLVARAPGRLDVMGGIADYSGARVLQYPIAEATFVAVGYNHDQVLRVVSQIDDHAGGLKGTSSATPRIAKFPLEKFAQAVAYGLPAVREFFDRALDDAWAAYCLGPLAVLREGCALRLDRGIDVLVGSSVPQGKGVASSAAVEVAALQALSALLGVELRPIELAFACQKAENVVVGAPCGVMDQVVATLGRSRQLLEISCQPGAVVDSHPLVAGLQLFGIDSGVRHAVGGADYTDVRVAAFMGHRMILEVLGAQVEAGSRRGLIRIVGDESLGYLANVSVTGFLEQYSRILPEEITGEDFLRKYAGTVDPVTRVEASKKYRVRVCAQHPVLEHERVQQFVELLRASKQKLSEETCMSLGRLMYASHQSYSDCGLGSKATDRIVELVRQAGPRKGFYGAKISGGGSGGTVVVLARPDAAPSVRALAATYAREAGTGGYLFEGSSAGASLFGCKRLRLVRGAASLLD